MSDEAPVVSLPPAVPPLALEKTDEEFLAENGFPQKTAVADMTPEQKAAYWHNQSKTQQKDADAFKKIGKTPAEIQKLIDDAEAARIAALSDADKALEKAKQEAAAGASHKFLAPAIEGQVVALTRGANETPEDALARVKGALKYIDATKFLDANGDLDAAEIQTFAQSIAPVAGGGQNPQSGDLLHQVFGGATPPSGESGGSVAAYREAAAKRLNPKQ
jgi:hypothetical protein